MKKINFIISSWLISSLLLVALPAGAVSNNRDVALVNYVSVHLSYNGNFVEYTTNDGSMSGSQLLTYVTGDSFVNKGGELQENVHYKLWNKPDGLTPFMRVSANGSSARLTFEGKALAHTSAQNNEMTVTYNAAAFESSKSTSIEVVGNSHKVGVRFLDDKSAVLSATGNFVEYATNDGSLAGSQLLIDVANDSFVNAGGVLTKGTHFELNNQPDGLMALMRVSENGSRVRLTFDGKAIIHTNASDVVLVVKFLDGAFAKTPVGPAGNYSVSTRIDFMDGASGLTLTPVSNQTVNPGQLLAVKITGQSRKLVPGQDSVWLDGKGGVWPVGDISKNGEVTSYDGALILQKMTDNISEYDKVLMDVNEDGRVTQADVDMVMQIAVKTIEHPGIYWYLRPSSQDEKPFSDSVYIGVRNNIGSQINFTVTIEGSSDGTTDNDIFDSGAMSMPAGSVATSKFDLYPDGVVTVLQASQAKVGQPARVRAMIRNGGTATTPAHAVRMEVRSLSDEDYRYEEVQIMPALRRNQSRYVIFTWTPPKNGNYYIDVVVDSDNGVVENSELNNRARVGFMLGGGQMGTFAIKSPEQDEKWVAGTRQRLMFDRDGVAKSSIYKLYLVDATQKVFGPYDVVTRSNNNIGYYTPDRTLSSGVYRVVVVSCWHPEQNCVSNNKGSYWFTSMSIGLIQLTNNARVLGDSDDIDEVEIEIEDESFEDDYVVTEASMVSKIDDKLVNRLKGRILLQVEKRGQAWYVDPVTGDRFYLKDGGAAYTMFHRAGLGITNRDLARIPVGLTEGTDEAKDTDGDGLPDLLEVAIGTDPNNADSDGDGFDDMTEVRQMYNPRGKDKLSTDNGLINRLRGRILLQVEDKGQAWYLSPVDGKRYLLSDGEQAYKILRKLSLGVKDADLQKISVGVMK